MAKTSFLILVTFFLGAVASSCPNGNILYSGETLAVGEYISYGSYVFIMQQDCNLVLYDVDKPIWATNTGGLASGCRAVMQADGNLVVYTQSNRPIWASNTGGHNAAHYVLVLQKDRNVVVYGPELWATGTYTGTLGIPASPPAENYPTAGLIKSVTEKSAK